MLEKQLLAILTNILQQNNEQFNSNQLFGLLSLILLTEIIEIFKLSQPKLNLSENSQLPAENLAGVLGQLQGNNNNTKNLQQLLPLLMGALGGNSGLDVNNLMKLFQPAEKKNTYEEAEEEGEEDKKKHLR